MKVLTAAEMRAVDRRTIEAGIPGIVLMENAGHRVVEFLEKRFAPLAGQRIVILCGKGNNGGDGMVIARQLATRFRPQSLDVVLYGAPEEKSIAWVRHPELMKRMKERQAPSHPAKKPVAQALAPQSSN